MTLKERFEALTRWSHTDDDDEEYADSYLKQDGEGYLFKLADVLELAEQLDRETTDAAAFGLACLSPEARLEAMAPWCSHCGGANPCNCMSDE